MKTSFLRPMKSHTPQSIEMVTQEIFPADIGHLREMIDSLERVQTKRHGQDLRSEKENVQESRYGG